jgi:hypothetical protein
MLKSPKHHITVTNGCTRKMQIRLKTLRWRGSTGEAERAFIEPVLMKASSRSSGRLAMERIHNIRLRVTAVHVDINFFSVRA